MILPTFATVWEALGSRMNVYSTKAGRLAVASN